MGFQAIQIHVACASKEEAKKIAHTLVEGRLAACVQIESAVESIYLWEGKMEKSLESRLTIKSFGHLFEAIAQKVRENHSYRTPEIIATELIACDPDYLSWMAVSTKAISSSE
jgi:periplasmic divalent cation tolerance protein